MGSLHAYFVRLDVLETAIGSGDERLVAEIERRWQKELMRRGSDVREGLERDGYRVPPLHRAVGELVDGKIRWPQFPELYAVAFELLCRLLGEGVPVGPFETLDGALVARIDDELARREAPLRMEKLCRGGAPLPLLACLRETHEVGHLLREELRDIGPAHADPVMGQAWETFRDWIDRASHLPGTVMLGFSGFH